MSITNGNEIVASMVMEQTLEPQRPKIVHVESSPGLHFVRFRACLQDFGKYNRNGRNYFPIPMKASWEAPHVKELIKRGDFFGEAGHPNSKDPQRVVSIDPARCCHRIIDKEFIGNAVFGIIETLNDKMLGEQFMGHILQGCSAAFSLRALCPITKIDASHGEVRSKSHIIAYDRVILPSHESAYQDDGEVEEITGAVSESTNPLVSHIDADVNIAVPVTESVLTNFFVDESKNLKSIIDVFEVAYDNITYEPTTESVILREKPNESGERRMFTVHLESYVKNQVSDILSNL